MPEVFYKLLFVYFYFRLKVNSMKILKCDNCEKEFVYRQEI